MAVEGVLAERQLQTAQAEHVEIHPPSDIAVLVQEQTALNVSSLDSSEKVEKVEEDPADFVRVPLTRFQFIVVLLSLSLGVFLVAIDFTIVSTAIPKIAQEFNSLDQIAWIGSGFFLTSTAFSPTYGSLCDLFGRKQTFLGAILFFEAGSLLCGAAPSMILLIIGRLIAGIGGGGVFACTLIMISDIVSLRDRGKYQGIIGAVFGLSSVVGPVLGGIFTDQVSWRWCFYINLPIGFIVIAVVAAFLKFPSPEGSMSEKLHKIDYLGTFLIVCASTFLLVPLQFGGTTWAWSDVKNILFFCIAPFFIAAFLYVEAYVAKNPLIPPRMFENRSVGLVLIIAFLMGNCFFSITYYVPTFFQLVNGESATTAGLESIPLIFGVVIFSIMSGQLISRTGFYKFWLFLGPVFLVTGQALLSTLNASTTKVAQVFFLLIAGIGIGCIIQVRILSVQASVSPMNIAVATSTSNFLMNMGGCLGVAIGGTFFNNVLIDKLGSSLAHEVSENPDSIRTLANSSLVIDGIASSLGFVYFYTIPLAALIFVLAFGVEEYKGGQPKPKEISKA